MTIDFYQNYDALNVMRKHIIKITTLSGNVRESVSILTPSILINGVLPLNVNYCYIPEFGRYYFIRDIIAEGSNLYRIELKNDALMSFAPFIDSAPCIAERSSNNYDVMLVDSKAIPKATNKWNCQRVGTFSFDKSNGKYVLGVV